MQSFTGSLQECLGVCAGQSGCLGVSYEASMEHGYKNCYLKKSASTAGLYKQQFVVDSAFRLGPASSVAASSTTLSLSSTTPSPSLSSAVPVGTASNSATPSVNSAQHSSMAWIAGAVIGPIAFIALVAGLVFLLYRWKRPGTAAQPRHAELSADAPGLFRWKRPGTTAQPRNAELSAEAPGLFWQQDRAPAKPVTELDGRPVGRV